MAEVIDLESTYYRRDLELPDSSISIVKLY